MYIAFDNLTTGPNSPLLPLRNRNYLYRCVCVFVTTATPCVVYL